MNKYCVPKPGFCLALIGSFLLSACGGGSGDGSGAQAGAPTLPGLITASAIVDANGDGKNDVVMGFQGGGLKALLLLQNDGDGSSLKARVSAFPEQYKGANGAAVDIQSGDFDGDGKRDLLVVTVDASPGSFYQSAQLQLFLGNGDGTFRDASANITSGTWPAAIGSPSATITGKWAERVRVADIDGDGALDFVATSDGSGTSGFIYLNDGAGHFAPTPITESDGVSSGTYTSLNALGGTVVDVLVADINGDGKVDLFAPGSPHTTFINTSTPGAASFTVLHSTTADSMRSGVLLDINGDGKLDVVGSLSMSGSISATTPVIALLGDGAGHFTEDNSVLSPQPQVVHAREFIAADVNGDGKQDVLIADHGWDSDPFPGARNWLLINNGSGVLVDSTSSSLDLLAGYTHQAAIGDLTGDGLPEILLNNAYCDGAFLTCANEPRFWNNGGGGAFTAFDPVIH